MRTKFQLVIIKPKRPPIGPTNLRFIQALFSSSSHLLFVLAPCHVSPNELGVNSLLVLKFVREQKTGEARRSNSTVWK